MLPKKSKAQFEALIEDATILESEFGLVKVAQLKGNRIIKLFRRKSLFSSQIWLPYGMRFKNNADKLRALEIPTIQVETVFDIPSLQRHAVIYPMLEGVSLREALKDSNQKEKEALLEKFATFVVELHQKGIHFRSLHLGNVLVLENGELGLIDVADMHFHKKRSLNLKERCRNFQHITRYQKDIDLLIDECPETFISTYLQACGSTEDQQQLKDAFDFACKNPKQKKQCLKPKP